MTNWMCETYEKSSSSIRCAYFVVFTLQCSCHLHLSLYLHLCICNASLCAYPIQYAFLSYYNVHNLIQAWNSMSIDSMPCYLVKINYNNFFHFVKSQVLKIPSGLFYSIVPWINTSDDRNPHNVTTLLVHQCLAVSIPSKYNKLTLDNIFNSVVLRIIACLQILIDCCHQVIVT